MIEVRNLAFSYGSRQVLRDVSFMASPGEVVTVVGANGSGKTTLLKVLATLAVPTAGRVLMDGQDVLQRPLKYRRQIGYLSERVSLYDDMSVKEYLHYRANLKGEPVKRVRRRVNEAVELCQVADALGRRIGALSVGYRKRVALADALLLRPRVLLLDDFLVGLDREMRTAAGTLLTNAAAFSSVIVTGHDIGDFVRWTTRFLVLRDGVVAATVDSTGLSAESFRERIDAALEGERG